MVSTITPLESGCVRRCPFGLFVYLHCFFASAAFSCLSALLFASAAFSFQHVMLIIGQLVLVSLNKVPCHHFCDVSIGCMVELLCS